MAMNNSLIWMIFMQLELITPCEELSVDEAYTVFH